MPGGPSRPSLASWALGLLPGAAQVAAVFCSAAPAPLHNSSNAIGIVDFCTVIIGFMLHRARTARQALAEDLRCPPFCITQRDRRIEHRRRRCSRAGVMPF